MKKRVIEAAIFAIIAICGNCAFSNTKADTSQTVAAVGNDKISLGEFSDRYEDYLIATGVEDNIRARYAILNNMINEILLREYDNNSKIYSNPEYKKEIAWAWKETVLAFFKDREIYAKISVTDKELRTAYMRSKVKLAVRHLYAPTKKEADNLYKLVKMGVSFNTLAKEVFTDTTLKNNGGYLGYITWGQTDPNFENAAYSLRVGEVSKPVKTAQGYSIIKVEKRIEDPFITENEFVNMKHKLTRGIAIDKKQPYEEAYIKKMFDTSKVHFNKHALQAILDDLQEMGAVPVEANDHAHHIYSNCVQYKNKVYSQREIEGKILEVPEYDRNLLTTTEKLKYAVIGLLIQDEFLQIAKDKGYDTSSYVTDTFDKLANNIYLKYKRNEVTDLVPVSDSEITAYYKYNIASYTNENEMNVQEIVVDNDSLASRLKKKIDSGEDFGLLASRYSLRKWSAKNNGMMGLSPVSKFGNLKDTLWNSRPGAVIGPVQFDKYYGLFRVLEKQDGRPTNINVVRDQIVKEIRNEKGFPYMKKRIEALSKKTTVKVNDDLIKNYTLNVTG
jgi:parvulin-like peptidyl-prolyl isomerase